VSDTRTITLADGRELAWIEWGAPDGAVLLFIHGTPGTRHQLRFDEVEARARSLRCINLDRPGFGASTFHRGRTYTSWAHDVESFMDLQGVDQFTVLGLSAGAPHALACAAVLDDRVRATVVVSGVPPNWMRSRNEHETDLQRKFRSAHRGMRTRVRTRLIGRSPRRAVEFLVQTVPPSDAAVVARLDVRRRLELDAASQPRAVARAILQDRELWEGPWELDLGSICTPVHIWHGTEDRSVPVGATHLLRDELQASSYHELEGAGHFFVFERIWEIVDAVG
jgi:pimeloyl-ACP methyl ester carboxylesterase